MAFSPLVQSLKILIADELELTRELAAGMLRSLGYEVDVACSGGEALDKAARERYAVVLIGMEVTNPEAFGVTPLAPLPKPPQREALRAAVERAQRRIIDWPRIDALAEFSPDMLKGVVRAFLNDAPVQLEAIAAAHRARNTERLVAAAHALKGSAANVGAVSVAELSGLIEKRARERRLDSLEPRVRELEQHLQDVQRALRPGA